MTPERWQQIDRVLQEALKHDPSQRAPFLDEACRDDDDLRSEVESLIHFREQARSFIEEPPLEVAADLLARDQSRDTNSNRSPERVLDCPSIVNGKYYLECCIGKGGMGVVYRARHLELRKLFALKLILPSKFHRPEYLSRFRIEAQTLGRLNHPNIVQVTDYGVDPEDGGLPYLVMEYMEGISLSDYIRERGPVSLDQALPVFARIASALDYAHASGVLHRDLKPSNVFLVQRESGPPDVKILDFGTAHIIDNSAKWESGIEPGNRIELTQKGTITVNREVRNPDVSFEQDTSNLPYATLTVPGTVLGTPEFISPEVLRGEKPSRAADIYSFGVLIYGMLVGQCPFTGSISELLDLHLHRNPSLPSTIRSSLPKELDQAILKPLNKDPASRPVSAREVVSELRVAHHVAQVRQWQRRELPRRFVLSVAVALLAVVLYPFLAKLPAAETLENKTFDARLQVHALRAPDPRITLVSVDEATLASDPRSLVDKADEAGTLLRQIFDAGARVVAVDLLLPEQWSHSETFSQLILDHSNNMVLAAFSSPEGRVVGPECVKGLISLALGPEKVEELFGFANLQQDSDGVVRRMRVTYQDQQGKRVYSFATRAVQIFMNRGPSQASSATESWVDYSINWTQFQRISWKDIPALLAKDPSIFRDRIVLAGGEYAGSDDIHSTARYGSTLPREVSGLVLQALQMNTLLEGRPIERISKTALIILLGLTTAVAVMVLLWFPRVGWAAGISALICLLYIAVSLLFFRWYLWLLPIAVPALVFFLAALCALLLRRKLPQFPELSIQENGI